MAVDPELPERPTSAAALHRDPLPLTGRAVLITGVSRRAGIGYATACRLAAYGASLCCHHFGPHDRDQPWGGDDIDAVLAGIEQHLVGEATLTDIHADLRDPAAIDMVVATAHDRIGPLDGLICNQALSGSDGPLGQQRAAMLDAHWMVNARASILLAQGFVGQHRHGSPASIVFLTSGQALGPMPDEVAYAAAKAAIAGVTLTIADQVADRGIRVNCVNPGPIDTGYLNEEMWDAVATKFPGGRYGRPDDAAQLLAWLITDEAQWITGQIINAEGGFARWR